MKLSRRTFLALTASLGLAACTSTGETAASVSSGTSSTADAVTLLMPGPSTTAACTRISKQLSEITQQELGFAVQLEQQPYRNYEDILWRRLMQGNASDVFWLPAVRSLSSYVYENTIYPLSTLLNAHPALYNCFTPARWNCMQKYRIIYAVPASTTDAYCEGFFVRGDSLDALHVSLSGDVWTMAQLHELLLQAKDAGLVPVVPDHGTVQTVFGQDPLNNDLGVLMNSRGTTVEDIYSSEEYAALCTQRRIWYRNGLILENACLRTEAAPDLLRACEGFGYFGKLNADTLSCASRAYGETLKAIPLSGMLQNSSSLSAGWSLPVQQSKKEEAIALLELLYTNESAAKLFLCGEESVDDDSSNVNRWCNAYCSLAAAGSAGTADFTQPGQTRVSPAYGFSFTTGDGTNELDNCTATVQRYRNALMSGFLEPADALPLFLEELQDSGIEQLMATKQAQLNDWLAANS